MSRGEERYGHVALIDDLLLRWRITVIILITAFLCTAGSSIIAPATHQILDDLVGPDGNEQVGILLTSVYVLGLGTGPFLFSPLSELYGRQVAYVLSSGMMVIFCAACCIPQKCVSNEDTIGDAAHSFSFSLPASQA